MSASLPRPRRRFDPFAPKPDVTTASDGPDPYGNPDPEWLRIDWREHLRDVDVGGDRGSTTSSSAPPEAEQRPAGARLRPRALGLLAELAREHPPLRAPPPGARARPARVRRLAGAGLGDLDPGLRAAAARLLRRGRRRRLRAWSATRWAASSPPRRRSTQPERFEKLVLVSAAGRLAARGCEREPTEVVAADARPPRPRSRSALQKRALPRARGAGDGLRRHLRQPRRAAPGAALGVLPGRRARASRSSRRSSSLVGYDFLDRLEEVEVPTPDRLGPPGPRRPAAPTRSATRSGCASSRARGLRPLRPRADGRAAGAVQPPARGVPRA